MELDLPKFVVMYRDQAKGEMSLDALFSRLDDAERHLNHYRPLAESELVTIEQIDDGYAEVLSALTNKAMRMVFVDGQPTVMPTDVARVYGHDCDCGNCGEGDD